MNNYYPITEVKARQILDSRGYPTIEAEVKAADYIIGRASVPSGASTGRFEAVELRDGTTEYFGLAVQNAVRHVNERIAKEITGMNVLEQENIDAKMIALDGTENKSNLGANAMLAVSMAVARAASAYMMQMPIFILIVGLIYWIEILSVMIQVTYFKKTGGKRIFKMAPIHHHFELCGWSETRVVAVFSIATAILCLIGLLAL